MSKRPNCRTCGANRHAGELHLANCQRYLDASRAGKTYEQNAEAKKARMEALIESLAQK